MENKHMNWLIANNLPISNVSKYQRTNQHSQHERWLRKFGQPFPFTHQVPLCHNALPDFTVIVDKAGAWRHSLVPEELVLKSAGIKPQCFETGTEFPLVSESCPYNHRSLARLVVSPDALQWCCWVIFIQDVCNIWRSVTEKCRCFN